MAYIISDDCVSCGACAAECPVGANHTWHTRSPMSASPAAPAPVSAPWKPSLRATASTLSTQTLALSAVLVQAYVLLELPTLSNQKRTISSSVRGTAYFFALLIAAA